MTHGTYSDVAVADRPGMLWELFKEPAEGSGIDMYNFNCNYFVRHLGIREESPPMWGDCAKQRVLCLLAGLQFLAFH